MNPPADRKVEDDIDMKRALMKSLVVASALALALSACGGDDDSSTSGGSQAPQLSGSIVIDGSSTVGPLTSAAAELFNAGQPNVKVTVGISGTGGGFEKFCSGETDISDASRPIKEDEEAPVCQKNGVAYNDVQIANDGIAVVTNKSMAVDCLTTDQLKQLWDKGSKVKSLNEI